MWKCSVFVHEMVIHVHPQERTQGRSRESELVLERHSHCLPQQGHMEGESKETGATGRWRGDRNTPARASAFHGSEAACRDRGRADFWCIWMSLGRSQVRARGGPCGRASFITLVPMAACFLRCLVLHPSPFIRTIPSFPVSRPPWLSLDSHQSWPLSCKGVPAGQFSKFIEAGLRQPLHISPRAPCTPAVLTGHGRVSRCFGASGDWPAGCSRPLSSAASFGLNPHRGWHC